MAKQLLHPTADPTNTTDPTVYPWSNHLLHPNITTNQNQSPHGLPKPMAKLHDPPRNLQQKWFPQPKPTKVPRVHTAVFPVTEDTEPPTSGTENSSDTGSNIRNHSSDSDNPWQGLH
jgi:hypothetical protein